MWKTIKRGMAGLSVALNIFFAASWLGGGTGTGHQGKSLFLQEDLLLNCEESFARGTLTGVKDYDPVEESYTCAYSDGSYYRAFSTVVTDRKE